MKIILKYSEVRLVKVPKSLRDIANFRKNWEKLLTSHKPFATIEI